MKGCGTYTWFGYTRSFAERLRAIKDAGFDTVSTFWAKEMEGIDAPLLSQYEICESFGLYLEHAHLPYFGIDVLWGDDLKAKAFTDNCISLVKTAAEGNIRTLVMHTCEIESPDPSRYPLLLENMKRIAGCCAESGVRLAVENLGKTCPASDIIRDLSGNEYVGLCFDSGHNNAVRENDFSLLRDFKDRVFALHIHDNNGKEDQHFLPMSDDCTVNWKMFMEAINSTSFEGSLMLESSYPIDYSLYTGEDDLSVPDPDYPMEDYLRDAYEACMKIYAEGRS
ncbi:MAG: sugar phosphate isomerase/epimerase [Eubacteriaceae bacterium]|nr:sugar phosphate isomerase/epimerase [Eubacteriaceae bacterium]